MGRFMSPDWDTKPVTVPYAKFGDPQTLNLSLRTKNSPSTAESKPSKKRAPAILALKRGDASVIRFIIL
jgi:hypothetical protein